MSSISEISNPRGKASSPLPDRHQKKSPWWFRNDKKAATELETAAMEMVERRTEPSRKLNKEKRPEPLESNTYESEDLGKNLKKN